MQFDFRPHRPRVPSAYQATKEAELWTLHHDYRRMFDNAGLSWEAMVSSQQKSVPGELARLKWIVSFQLYSSTTADILIQTGTLDRLKDQRLIQIIGTNNIPMYMRPYHFSGWDEQEAWKIFQSFLPKFKAQIGKLDLHAAKLRLVSRWVEAYTSFDRQELNLAI